MADKEDIKKENEENIEVENKDNKAGAEQARAGQERQEGVKKEESSKEDSKKQKKAEKAEKKNEKSAKAAEKEMREKEIEELAAKVAVINDKYVRLAAEFDNYRRRTAKERLDLIASAGEDVIKGLLPVLDDCERALDVLRKSSADKAAIEGTELIYNKLMTFLKSKGLSVIEAIGKPLDTDYHEAVAQFPVQEEEKKNTIIDIAQQGYMLNEKVIRFAKVVVGI